MTFPFVLIMGMGIWELVCHYWSFPHTSSESTVAVRKKFLFCLCTTMIALKLLRNDVIFEFSLHFAQRRTKCITQSGHVCVKSEFSASCLEAHRVETRLRKILHIQALMCGTFLRQLSSVEMLCQVSNYLETS